MILIPEIKEVPVTRFERVGAHSHIRGLGLDGLKAKTTGDGLVGQAEAREAAGIVVDMVRKGKFAGRAILLAGAPGTGKTAIAVGISRELGRDVPFVPISGSEIYSTEMKKTEFLMQSLRKAIGVRIHEMRKIYEGEVLKLDIEKVPHPYNPYQQVPRSATVRLKTKKEQKQFRVDQTFAMSLLQQGVEPGDVIQIDVDTGRIAKLGKTEKSIKEQKLDLSTQQAVPIPPGDVIKEKEFIYTLSLHDLDLTSARRSTGFFGMFFGGEEKAEITNEIRQQIDEMVKEWVDVGRAEIIPGVMFVDEVHMLDIEAFAFLNRAMESELAPIIILASNRGVTKIRGTEVSAPHGVPLDLLDRLLIITTRLYNKKEIEEILKIRSKEEKIELEENALEYLTDVGVRASLRYAVQLVAPAHDIAVHRKNKKITKKDIKEAEKLFSDVKRSVKHLKEYEKLMLSGG